MKRRQKAKGIKVTIERRVKRNGFRFKSISIVRINNEDGC